MPAMYSEYIAGISYFRASSLFGLKQDDALGEEMPAITLIQCLYFRSYPVWSIQSWCPGGGDASYYSDTMSLFPSPILFGLYRVDALGEEMPAITQIQWLYFQVLSCLVHTELVPWEIEGCQLIL